MHKVDTDSEDVNGGGITRRGFLGSVGTVFAGVFLPKIEGTSGSFAVPVYPETQVMVVGRSEIGIAVVDCAQDPLMPVEGATVKIVSHYNDKSTAGTSDAQGKITLDLAGLAEEDSPDSPAAEGSKKEEYCLNATVCITCEGYRDVVIPRARLRSVSALIAPTRKLEEGVPYIRELSFDGWDIQYTQATFLADESNNGMHTLTAEVWVPGAASCDISFYYLIENEETGKVDSVNIADDTLTSHSETGAFESTLFEKAFLDTSIGEAGLPAGCEVHVAVVYEDTVYDQVCGLKVKEPPIAACESGEVTLSPATFYDDSMTLFTLPKSLPKPLGGSSFNVWKPVFDNVGFDFSPAGYLMVGITIGSMSALNENGSALDRDAWKEWPDETATEQYKRVTGKMTKKMNKVKDMYSALSDSGKIFSHSCSSMITATGSFQVFANLDYDWKTEYWGGALNAVIGGNVDGTWTIQMLFLGVPLFISFDAFAELDAGLTFAARTYGNSIGELFDNMTYNADSSTIAITSNLEIGLSVGVGVAGALSVYLRGSGYIAVNIAFYQGAPQEKSPRLTVGAGLSASLGIQALIFKWSGTIWAEEWPTLVDTASSRVSPQSLGAERVSAIDLSSIADEMQIVTNAELYAVREFEAAGSAVQVMSAAGGTEVASRELEDGSIEWTMPPAAESADDAGIALLSASEAASYLGDSATGSDPTANIGIAGLGESALGGIKPSADTVIFKNVFSDVKVKVVRFGSRDVMLRIASAGYGNEARTRLTYCISEDGAWSAPVVIDFDPAGAGVSRGELFDYDFDATVVGSWESYLYVMLVSGTRPDGDTTSFTTANSATYISLIRLYDANFPNAPLQVSTAVSWRASGIMKSTKASFSFSLPRITSFSDTASYDNETNSCLVGTCLIRQATTASGLLAKNARCYLTSFFAEHRRGEAPKVVTKTARVSPSGIDHLVMGPVTFPDQLQSSIRAARRYVTLGVTGSPADNEVCSGVYSIVVDFDEAKNTYSISHEIRVNPYDNYDVTRLYPTGSDGEFYAIRTGQADEAAGAQGELQRDGRLYLASFNPTAASDFAYTPVGPQDFSPSELAVSSDGRYLYYAVNKEGASGQKTTSDGTLGGTVEDAAYRIMAMACVEGLFTKPFVLCELTHPVDRLVAMTSKGSAATLIAAEVTDISKSRADIHDIRIPLAVCATPLSFASVGPFVYAGEESEFDVSVRNDGNTIISGFTVELLSEDGDVVDKTSVILDAAVLSAGGSDEDDAAASSDYELEALPSELAASPLASAASGSLLAPGKTATYRVAFKIPSKWSNERTVRVRINNSSVLIIEPQGTMSLMSRKSGSGASGTGDIGDTEGNNEAEAFSDFIEDWEASLFSDPDRSYKIKRKKLPSFDVSILKSTEFDDGNLVRADCIAHAANSNPFVAR